jgi:prolyl oligopeptidase
MKPVPVYALTGLALGLAACVGVPQTMPGDGPGGKPMTTATQQAVGANPNPREAPVYPVMIDMSGGRGHAPAAAESDEALRWLENLDTPAVKQWVEGQNKVSLPKLAALPLRARLQERVAQLAAQHEPLPPELDPGRLVSPSGYVARRAPDGEAWEIVRPDGQVLPERVRARSVAWGGDGLYYGWYMGEGRVTGVYLHRPGEAREKDTLVYAASDPAVVPMVQTTAGGRYLVITLQDDPEHSAVQLLDLQRADARPLSLFTATDAAQHTFIGSSPGQLYFLTTRGAPRGRIVAVSSRDPAAGAVTVVPESAVRLERAAYAGGRFITAAVEDGRSVVRMFTPDGKPAGEVALPGAGHVQSLGGESEILLTYTDYLTPLTAYRVDLASGRLTRWSTAAPVVDTSAYVTDRIVVPGEAEAASVLVYVTHRRDQVRDGDQPLVLQGSAQLLPSFNPEVLAWLELGGAYAQVSVQPERSALVRRSGLDDLQAAAAELVRLRYTRTRRLGLFGRGSSALAVAAVLAQHPENYGAAVSQLTAEAGDESRPALETYAPFRRVRKGLCYPPILVTTLDHDSRVAPSDGYMLAARLQAVQLCSNPVLVRVDPRSGTDSRAEVGAEQWAFLGQWLGLTPPGS